MNILALDCSTDFLSIALQKKIANTEAIILDHQTDGGAKASAQLIAAIQNLMTQAQLSFNDLGGIVFGAGPGAFTGLRTAAAVAQGLAFGADIPILGLNTLAAVAEAARQEDFSQSIENKDFFFTIATLDARMGQVYAQAWGWAREGWNTVENSDFQENLLENKNNHSKNPSKIHWKAFSEALALQPEDLEIPKNKNPKNPENPIIWTLSGNAATVYPNLGKKIQSQIATHYFCRPTARALLAIAPQFWSHAHAGHNAHRAELAYVRDRVALTTAERLAAGGAR